MYKCFAIILFVVYCAMFKPQSKCYRLIKGEVFINHADLIYGDIENAEVVAQAKTNFKKVRRIKHPNGYYQLFVSN